MAQQRVEWLEVDVEDRGARKILPFGKEPSAKGWIQKYSLRALWVCDGIALQIHSHLRPSPGLQRASYRWAEVAKGPRRRPRVKMAGAWRAKRKGSLQPLK